MVPQPHDYQGTRTIYIGDPRREYAGHRRRRRAEL